MVFSLHNKIMVCEKSNNMRLVKKKKVKIINLNKNPIKCLFNNSSLLSNRQMQRVFSECCYYMSRVQEENE